MARVLWPLLLLPLLGGGLGGGRAAAAKGWSCRQDDVTFELITGFVYSAPKDVLDTRTGTLKLSDCIAACQDQAGCQSLNFETGLCVLFSSSAETHPGGLAKSQFPVFTLFAQKTCLRGAKAGAAGGAAKTGAPARNWAFETVRGHVLRTSVRRHHRVASRRDCMQLCLDQRDFVCRSANFHHDSGDCSMSDMDRFTVSGMSSLTAEERVDYLESNCVSDPIKMCDFTEQPGRILKTVDSVHQDVASLADCRKLCLQSTEFRCHSFDYEDTGPKVCRLSHHAAPSLQHIEEPYLELDKAITYQLTACYNVTIDCRGTDMVARVQTNKVFNGKVYAKSRPNSCVSDVVNSLDFQLKLGYHDLNCDVKQDAPGKFSADIIIQHHDQIVTGQDVGLSARCSYSLENSTVGHGVRLEVAGEPGGGGAGANAGAAGSGGAVQSQETTYVVSPTVTMRITDRRGEDIHTAQVGDALSLRFYILDQHTPYQIFVRELIALDGVDSSEILLIDSLGCPTDPTIMGAISTVDTVDGSQVLQAPFDAFKFPTSDVVQFKALVTPCLPKCEPVVCDVEDYYGMVRRVDSYGRRRRREVSSKGKDDDVILMQSIRIADKFQFEAQPRGSLVREITDSLGERTTTH
ncbi:uncharacterized protein LOC117639693 [Thrips palmi]|uniref:Uncharacterized protein LOC117639693 n=1 Tax=Thrips palmi TaxID=161013 RepID=A0A6P8ZH94_THRPL|nr:uncharacterized protein LOC117639693 [Thrips palmi]